MHHYRTLICALTVCSLTACVGGSGSTTGGSTTSDATTQLTDTVQTTDSATATDTVQTSDSSTSQGGGSALKFDEFIKQMTTAVLCPLTLKCNDVTFSDISRCEEFFKAAAIDDEIAPFAEEMKAVAKKTVTYNDATAAACLAKLEKAAKNAMCDKLDDGFLEKDPECDKVFIGTVALTGACASTVECKQGYCATTKSHGTTCPGTCKPTLKDGQACDKDGPSDACDGELVCGPDGKCGTPSSTAKLKEGDSCDPEDSDECDKGLYCHGGHSTKVANKCAKRVAAGGDCSDGKECVKGQRCKHPFSAPSTGVCVTPKKLGDPCDGSRHCAALDSYCKRDSSGQAGTCALWPSASEVCSPSWPMCWPLYGVICDITPGAIDGKCVGAPGAGAKCISGTCAHGLICGDDGNCGAKLASDQSCEPTGDNQCASGLHCDETTSKCVASCGS